MIRRRRKEFFGWLSNIELVRFYPPAYRRAYWADRALRNFRRRMRGTKLRQTERMVEKLIGGSE
jgi:hypothetical protein